MPSTVDEIAPDVFRIAAYVPDFGIGFSQFLVRDEEPLLYHTGFRRFFPDTLEAVARVIDPAKLRWIGFSHFEPDECGALNEWLAVAPNAQPIASLVGAGAMLADVTDRPARAMVDGETLTTGKRRFSFQRTPHLPHGWDASLLFEETERTLFCSDLFLNHGDQPPINEADILTPARDAVKASLEGPFAHDLPYTPHTRAALHRLAALQPRTLATMHGAAYRGDGEAALLGLADILQDYLANPNAHEEPTCSP